MAPFYKVSFIALAICIGGIAFIIHNVTTPTPDKSPTVQNTTPPKILSHDDSEQVRTKLLAFETYLDKCEVANTKMMNQYNRFCTMFKSYQVSQYKVYKAAELTKEVAGKLGTEISNNFEVYDLPDGLRPTMNTAIADIAESYTTEERAMESAMDIYNGEGNFKDVDKFHSELQLARENYADGIASMFIVEQSFGLHKKQVRKRKQ